MLNATKMPDNNPAQQHFNCKELLVGILKDLTYKKWWKPAPGIPGWRKSHRFLSNALFGAKWLLGSIWEEMFENPTYGQKITSKKFSTTLSKAYGLLSNVHPPRCFPITWWFLIKILGTYAQNIVGESERCRLKRKLSVRVLITYIPMKKWDIDTDSDESNKCPIVRVGIWVELKHISTERQ